MPPRAGYLLGAYRNPGLEAEMESGTYPRTEYSVYFQRPGVRPLCYDDVKGSGLGLPRTLLRRGYPHWGLPALALPRRRQFDRIIVSGDDVWVPLLIQSLLRKPRCRVYNIAHGSFFGSAKFARLMRRFSKWQNVHYLCLADSLRRALVEQFGVPAENAHNTSYGIDTRFFRPMGCPDSPPFIASAGTANRDYKTLVKAAAPLGVEVRIAADSAWFPAALDIAGCELPSGIEARSYGDYTNLRDLYARSLFVVVPLYPARHACGYAVIAEAMAMGKPVITTRTEAHSDFVVDGETGFYVEPGDCASLQERMDYLLRKPAEVERMGAAARARMESLFTVESYCERIAAIAES